MKKNGILLLILSIFVLFAGCTKKEEPKRYDATFLQLFDTMTTVVGFDTSKDNFTEFAEKVKEELEVYHQLYDIYNDYDGINNIKTINDNAGIAPVKVDQKIIDMLKFARWAHEFSEGKINIAYGAVLRVWHDYRTEGMDDPENAQLPPADILEENAKHTDIHKMIIDEAASTVYLEDPSMSLDVGAIAKGYATEQVALSMMEQGYDSAMISVGGNVRAIGAKPGNIPWNVGIQNPDMDSTVSNLYILKLTGHSLVTSGDYQRYYVVDGIKYHHIIDPDTRMPSDYFTSVSIICEDSGMGDALSTIIYNTPFEQGLALIESLEDAQALWVFKDGTMKYSSGFRDMIWEE